MREAGLIVHDQRLSIGEASFMNCIRLLDTMTSHAIPPGSLNVAFVDEAECSRLHSEYFDDPEITDVMTFPGEEGDDHAGDIAICPLVAARYATRAGSSFKKELTLYLVHGWLHLSGLEDNTEVGTREMRLGESELLATLEEGSALLDATWMETAS